MHAAAAALVVFLLSVHPNDHTKFDGITRADVANNYMEKLRYASWTYTARHLVSHLRGTASEVAGTCASSGSSVQRVLMSYCTPA